MLSDKTFEEEVINRTPLGRVGDPNEVSTMVAFPSLPASSLRNWTDYLCWWWRHCLWDLPIPSWGTNSYHIVFSCLMHRNPSQFCFPSSVLFFNNLFVGASLFFLGPLNNHPSCGCIIPSKMVGKFVWYVFLFTIIAL